MAPMMCRRLEVTVNYSYPWLFFRINSGNCLKSSFLDLYPLPRRNGREAKKEEWGEEQELRSRKGTDKGQRLGSRFLDFPSRTICLSLSFSLIPHLCSTSAVTVFLIILFSASLYMYIRFSLLALVCEGLLVASLCQSFLLQSHHSHCGSHLWIHFRTAWSKSWVFGGGGQVSYCLFGKQFSPQITGVCRLQTDEDQCPQVRCLAPQAASSLGGPGLAGRQQSTSTEPAWPEGPLWYQWRAFLSPRGLL